MENLGNDFATTLNGGIDATQTSITVTSGTGSPDVEFRIRIDNELMLVTSKGGGTDWTVQRNIEGTTGSTHANAAVVAHVMTLVGLKTHGLENMAAIFPGAETGARYVVKDTFQLNVVDELVIDGELIVEGQTNILSLT